MKKLATIAIMSAALLGSQAAYASHPLPVPSTYQGVVVVTKGITLNCTLTISFTSSSNATIHLGPPQPECAALSVDPSNVTYSYDSSTHTVTFNNVYVKTITAGDCSGTITAEYDPNYDELIAIGTLPPATTGTPACSVDGLLERI